MSLLGSAGRRLSRRVAVGISGGVDSAVAAILLKRRGFEVVGVFMRNWDTADETGRCAADRDAEDAERFCRKLQVPFREVSLVKEYWGEVFSPLLADYQAGLTPNPDVLCNRHIKFDHFHRVCLEQVGCDAIATGHYARNSYGEDLEYADPSRDARLLKAVDLVKDQTFFLSRIRQVALRRAMFPVGNLTKSVVKKLAAAEGFPEIASRQESMGICFIGKRSFQDFISEYVEDSPGDIVDVDDGRVIGQHRGLHHWTVGQRLAIGLFRKGCRPYNDGGRFVAGKDPGRNLLLSCDDTDHPALFCEHFHCARPRWIRSRGPGELRRAAGRALDCEYRFQNVQPLTNCVVTLRMVASAAPSASLHSNWESVDRGSLTVSSAEPKRAVTPGQYVAFYKGDECLGSAVIERPGPSLLTMARADKRAREGGS